MLTLSRLPLSSGLLLLSASHIYATGLEQAYQSARGSALGNAIIANIDDASSLHHNPAGLAGVKDIQLQSHSIFFAGENKYSGPSGSFKAESDFAFAGSLFLAAPISDVLGVGIGITTPHGLKAEYNDNIPIRTLGVEGTLEHIRYSLGLGWQATPTLSLGASIIYAHDDLENIQGIFTPGDRFRYQGTGDAWGWTAGLQWEPVAGHRFAANYRSGMSITTRGSTTVNSLIPQLPSGTSAASSRFNYPDQFLAGYSFEKDRWLFEVNFQHTEWSRVRTITLNQETPILPIPTSVQNWKDSQFYSLGATYQWKKDIELRFGYLYGTQSVPDAASSTLLVDSPYHALSMGVGIDRGDWEFDVAIIASIRETQNISGNLPSPVDPSGATTNGEWKTNSFGLHLGVTRHF